MLRQAGQTLVRHLARPLAPAGTRGIQYFDAPNGPAVSQVPIEEDWYCRQRKLVPLLDKMPFFVPSAWIAPNATVVGDVNLYEDVSASSRMLQRSA